MAKPLNIKQLEIDILPFEHEDETDLVSAAAAINRKGEVVHAALFTRFENENRIFHFTGKAVLFEDSDSVSRHFYKELLFIPSDLVPAFIAHCELISENAQPNYGYFYSGSSLYDEEGKFRDASGLPESMTCVGFCLNVLKHFLGDGDLLAFSDWTSDTAPNDFIDKFFEEVKKVRPSLSLVEFKRGVRRILPLEYFTAACSNDLNVTKTFTDQNCPTVHHVLVGKLASS